MKELLTSICSYIGANSLGIVGTDLLSQTLPSTPYVCTGVFLAGGASGPDQPIRERSLQIFHRNTNVTSATCLVTSLYALFRDQWNKLADFPGRFVCDDEPVFVGYDVNNMPVYSFDITFTSTK